MHLPPIGRSVADRRDELADERDRISERRDAEAERRDALAERAETNDPANAAAANARKHAAADRLHAARDRHAAASERRQADSDRKAATAAREVASFDALTGAYLRGPGTVQLRREIARGLRTREPLALGFLDVDGLRATNNAHGHAAGDRLLQRVAEALRVQLRSYDLVVRFGGDEFVCLFVGIDVASAAERCALLNRHLSRHPEGGSVAAGLAELRPGDSIEALIARADAALYENRARARSARDGGS